MTDDTTPNYNVVFATPPIQTSFFNFDEKIIEVLKELEYVKSIGNTSSSDKYILKNYAKRRAIRNLKKHIDGCLDDYVRTVFLSDQKLSITQSWVNITSKGQSHSRHVHYNSIVSGVFYLKTSETTPPIILDNHRCNFPVRPSQNLQQQDGALNFVLNDTVSLSPQTGQLILFPSDIVHSVPENTSDTDRISLGFNTFFKRPFGSVEDSTYYD